MNPFRNFGVMPVLEDMRSIDVREWVRLGLLREQHFIADWNLGTRKIAGYICIPRGDHVYLSYYRQGGEPVTQLVQLAGTPCNFGGHRQWVRCPTCQSRRALLFLIRDRLICRECSHTPYYTQQVGDVDRLMHKRQKIEVRLDKRLRRITRERTFNDWVQVQDEIEQKVAGTNRSLWI